MRKGWLSALVGLGLLAGAIGLWQALASGPTPSPVSASAPRPVADPLRIKVVTANIRLPDSNDKNHAWVERRELLLQTLLRQEPDIVGLQEVSPAQLAYLIQKMEGYQFAPRGEEAAGSVVGALAPLTNIISSLNVIFFRADRWDVVEAAHGPVRPGVLQENPAENTFYTLVTLRDRLSRLPDLIVLDTHLRHGVPNATVCARRIHEILAASRGKFPQAQAVVLGDMNHGQDSAVYAALRGEAAAGALVDTFDYAKKAPTEQWGTWHGFTGKSRADWPIDLVLVSSGLRAEPASIIRDHDPLAGRWPTDHFPVSTVLHAGPASP